MATKVKECIICGNKKFDQYCKDVVRCTNCTLVFADEMPTPKELDKLYQEDYFFGMEYSDYKADRSALEHNFKNRINDLKKYLRPKATVVEVGCAYGYFLNMIKADSKEHIGFDVSREGVQFAKEELSVNATNEDFLKYKIKTGSVDLVAMWDVIEHLTEPERYIRQAATILKPGGCLALTTGDVDKLIPRIKGGKWRMIHPPTHVYYFSAKTLSTLLETNGFTVKDIKYHSTYRNTGSVIKQLAYNQKARGKTGIFFDVCGYVARITKLEKLNIPINTFDIMEVIATKNGK